MEVFRSDKGAVFSYSCIHQYIYTQTHLSPNPVGGNVIVHSVCANVGLRMLQNQAPFHRSLTMRRLIQPHKINQSGYYCIFMKVLLSIDFTFLNLSFELLTMLFYEDEIKLICQAISVQGLV